MEKCYTTKFKTYLNFNNWRLLFYAISLADVKPHKMKYSTYETYTFLEKHTKPY